MLYSILQDTDQPLLTFVAFAIQRQEWLTVLQVYFQFFILSLILSFLFVDYDLERFSRFFTAG